MVFLLFVKDESLVELRCRDGALSTPQGRSSVERALVTVTHRLGSSPANWRIDVSTGAVTMPGCTMREIEGALADQASADSIFEIPAVDRPAGEPW